MRTFITLMLWALPAAAAAEAGKSGDDIAFFESEAQVVTASRQAVPPRKAPASVYVISSADIEAAGPAARLWDLLRNVPGVDVTESRAFYANVSIRGLNEPVNNRTLVLLDGKSVLHSFYGIVNWEDIPVSLSEIDRIEVVEGPASALYGANAVQGVINIVTKEPGQLNGGELTYSAGSGNVLLGSALYGEKTGKLGYKVGADQRAANGFERDGAKAQRNAKAHALVSYDLAPETSLSVSGAYSRIDSLITVGSVGTVNTDGYSSYLRSDFRHRGTKAHFFWNRDRIDGREFAALQNPNMDSDSYDFTLERSLELAPWNTLTVGGGYTKNTVSSVAFLSRNNRQELWALFLEDKWDPSEMWALVVSARYDHHSLAGDAFSPRASAVYSPTPRQSFRLSAGTAFKNPNLVENYLALVRTYPNTDPLTNGTWTAVQSTIVGDKGLKTEKMQFLELAHNGIFGKLRTNTAVYTYLLKDIVRTGAAAVVCDVACIPVLKTQSSFMNSGSKRAWGAETGAEWRLDGKLGAFANYTFLSVEDTPYSPRHKANGGVRYSDGRASFNLWSNWVDKTRWQNSAPGAALVYRTIPSYAVLNGRAGYGFRGKLSGLRAGLTAFNLFNNKHFETAPWESSSLPGQNGEWIGARYSVDLSYRF